MQLFITGLFLFLLDLFILGTVYVLAADIKSIAPSNGTVPVQLVKGNQKIQIGDREPYIAFLTTLVFDDPQCIAALKIDALSPLTGAEEIEIIYTICSDGDTQWQLAHYENQKNVYILRNPVYAKRISVLNGKRNISIVDIDFKLCSNLIKSMELDESFKTCETKPHKKKRHRKRHRHVPTIKLTNEEVFIRHRIKRDVDEMAVNEIADGGCVTGNCMCEPGWSGPLCLNPDCSMVRNCSNNGICLRPSECRCNTGFIGSDCSQCIGPSCGSGNSTCDYDCVHGKCDLVTKSCLCQESWSGAACDMCLTNNCPTRPELSLILPQTAEVDNPNINIYVHGSDFPQPQESRYNCLFGGIATQGVWISPSLIRCPTPPRARPEKHVFNVVPYGTSEYVPYEDDRTLHFTFFAPCDPNICRGNCLGPLCVCNHNQSGPMCASEKPLMDGEVKVINDPSVVRTKEGSPYAIAVPDQDHDTVITIDSPLTDLILNPFDNTLRWNNPIGSNTPYPIVLRIYSQSTITELRWNLTVDPSYLPIISKVDNTSDSNKVVLSGYVDKKESSLKNLSVEIEIFNGTEFLEKRQTVSNDGTMFRYEVYPYLVENMVYVARAQHPGVINDTSPFISWASPKIRISYEENIKISNETFFLTYRAQPNGFVCQWKISIIEPIDKILVVQQKVIEEGNIQNIEIGFGTTLKFPFLPIELMIMFNCDGVNGIVTRQTLSTEIRGDIVSFTPEQIYIVKYDRKEPQLVQIEVQIHRIYSEIQSLLASENSLYPFYLVASTPIDNILSNMTVKLILGLTADYNNNVGSVDGILHFPNTLKPILSIPYRIRRGTNEDLNFVLIIKSVIDTKNGGEQQNDAVEVQIFNTDRSLFYSKMARMNTPTEFFPIPSGFYQLVLKADDYATYSEIVKITPDMNTMTIYLRPRSPLYAVFDNENFEQEKILFNEEIFTTLSITPSVFKNSHMNEEIFVDIVYENGQNDSFLMINGLEGENFGPFRVELPEISEPLCLTCGLRVPLRFIQTEDDPSLWNSLLTCTGSTRNKIEI